MVGLPDSVPAYAAPALNEDYTDFPPTITFVGDLEPFRDETIAYVDKLKKQGIPLRFELFKGAFHAFEILGAKTSIGKGEHFVHFLWPVINIKPFLYRIMSKQIKRILRIAFILVSISSLYFVPWILVWAWILPLPDTVQEQMEEGIGHGFDGMIVYVDKAGQAPAFYAAGWHERQHKIPAKPNAFFKIASISKLYTAVAVSKLVKDEQLSLDKSLAEYFPELAGRIEYADKITLRLMVQHRSGIPNYTDNPDFWVDQPSKREEALEFALDLPAAFAPDDDYGYSNTNYLLIRLLIEKVLGYDHFQYIKEEILLPLELTHTFGSVKEVPLDEMMSGYHVGYSKDLKTDDRGMVATAEDVGIFLRALNDGSVFEEGEQDIYSSIYVYEHTGLVPGYQSIAKYHEEIDAVVVQFTNTTNFQGYNWNLSEILYGRIVRMLKREKKAD